MGASHQPLVVATGNHHLFLILTTRSGEEWIVLLGKRKAHFPFYGTRFDNATFYNVAQKKLFHQWASEMKEMTWECGKSWRMAGQHPIPFSLELKPEFLKKSGAFFKQWLPIDSKYIPGAAFTYHLLQPSGQLQGEAIQRGTGFSERGNLSTLTSKVWETPFHYFLELNAGGGAGMLQWKAQVSKAKNILEFFPRLVQKTFLHDQFVWGERPSEKLDWDILTTTEIPFPQKRLRREIVTAQDRHHNRWYGLRESFF